MTGGQLLTIVIAGALTFAIRVSFLARADRMVDLSPTVREVLRMIPAAALAALVVPTLLRPDGSGWEPFGPLVLGGVAAVLVARWRRDLLSPMVAGVVVVVLTRPFLG